MKNKPASATPCHGLWPGALIWFPAFLFMLFSTPLAGADLELKWRPIPPLPDSTGFAGAFAGVNRGALLVGGGANFPEKMPWEGGTKVWHDRVFVLEHRTGAWRSGFKLPRPCGYGVSVTLPDGVVCIGGSDSARHLTNVFLMRWNGERLECKDLPSLPVPLANSCGARIGTAIYVAGGTATPEAKAALKRFLRLDLKAGARWEEIEPWPGPARMLATAAGVGNSFLLIGGADLSPGPNATPQRHYLKDVFSYTPGRGWKRLSDLPNCVVAAANPAPVVGETRVLLVGGDDGTQVNFEPKSRHPGFPKKILCYELPSDRWTLAGESPAPRATLPTAYWNGAWIFPSGEVKPGVRSPEVWSLETR